MTDVNGKVTWITGASSGIGAALAKVFSDAGSDIILSGRNIAALESVADALSTKTLILPFEVTDYEGLKSHVDEAWNWLGHVDILINNAGVSQRSLAIHTKPQVYTDLLNIDLIAPIWLTQLNLPNMVELGGAHIVAISSIAGRIGAPLRTAYSAAKHGLIGYMDALRAEVELHHSIHVTNVLPGAIATNVAHNALTKDGTKLGKSAENIDNGDDPLDCARAILEAVQNRKPELIHANSFELNITNLRHSDPDAFFKMIGDVGAQTAAGTKKWE
ncbi:SDR family NAD(P)-dependent oxidoreductase [Fretibacter rubidus]|uniref:SDR family NAD(P)-dependent oxidoreductase n=1 Tax=Fretibacter rubidus TaxID=570162 RepID=UPI00352B2A0C